jgi:hypothetical protein
MMMEVTPFLQLMIYVGVGGTFYLTYQIGMLFYEYHQNKKQKVSL